MMFETTEIVMVYLTVGAAAGFLAGLLGIGGGFVVVPTLIWFWHFQPIPDSILTHLAIGTAHATVIVTAISSVMAHHRRGAVLWAVLRQLTTGVAIGAFVGVTIAQALPGDVLRKIYGAFVLLIAIQMIFAQRSVPQSDLPGFRGMLAAGGVVGTISAINGIGGASMVVAFLTWCRINIREAIGTASACGLPVSIASTIGFIAAGWNTPNLPEWSIGYVYLPAVLAIVAASIAAAPLGAKLSHSLPTATLKKGFAGFLVFIGTNMLIS